MTRSRTDRSKIEPRRGNRIVSTMDASICVHQIHRADDVVTLIGKMMTIVNDQAVVTDGVVLFFSRAGYSLTGHPLTDEEFALATMSLPGSVLSCRIEYSTDGPRAFRGVAAFAVDDSAGEKWR